MTVGGIVLCGGRSSRMGRPKVWLPVGDEFLLPRVVRVLNEVVSPVVVVAAVGQELPPLPPSAQIVRDEVPDRGPLQGLLAGLERLDGVGDVVFVSACDAPRLRASFIRSVLLALGSAEAVVPDVGGHLHPLAAAYRVTPTLRAVRELLATGRSAVRELAPRLMTRTIAEAEVAAFEPHFDSLQTANTPAEFARIVPPADPNRDGGC